MKHYNHLIWDDRWDDRSVEHIARHRVTPDEVEDAVFSARARIRRGREGLYYIFGLSREGRYLFMVLRDLEGGVGRVITARDMSSKEKRWYFKER